MISRFSPSKDHLLVPMLSLWKGPRQTALCMSIFIALRLDRRMSVNTVFGGADYDNRLIDRLPSFSGWRGDRSINAGCRHRGAQVQYQFFRRR